MELPPRLVDVLPRPSFAGVVTRLSFPHSLRRRVEGERPESFPHGVPQCPGRSQRTRHGETGVKEWEESFPTRVTTTTHPRRMGGSPLGLVGTAVVLQELRECPTKTESRNPETTGLCGRFKLTWRWAGFDLGRSRSKSSRRCSSSSSFRCSCRSSDTDPEGLWAGGRREGPWGRGGPRKDEDRYSRTEVETGERSDGPLLTSRQSLWHTKPFSVISTEINSGRKSSVNNEDRLGEPDRRSRHRLGREGEDRRERREFSELVFYSGGGRGDFVGETLIPRVQRGKCNRITRTSVSYLPPDPSRQTYTALLSLGHR